jgi:hypothetical protein
MVANGGAQLDAYHKHRAGGEEEEDESDED